MQDTEIKFINHASVLVNQGEVGLLSDPWYKNSVFHKGWRLIYETHQEEISNVLEKTSHIYISHEHPDHFNTGFLLNEDIKKKIFSKKIKILFQKTQDRRVANFLSKNGYEVIECVSGEKIKLSNKFEIQIVKHDFYDSSISIKTPDINLINLNDCPLHNVKSIKNFKKKYGVFDLLLTQFSYAAWKGGVDKIEFRQKAAKEKLLCIKNQAQILECKKVIPFASFIYFSNKSNFYMNDSINTTEKLTKYFNNSNFELVIMKPNEQQSIKKLKQNYDSVNFWATKYQMIKKMECSIDEYEITVDEKILIESCNNYRKNIFKKNSKILIFILSKIKFLKIFQRIYIFIKDKNQNYEYSIFSGLKKTDNKHRDISLHSQSLLFLFKNEFGFDTLTVNGCFETSIEEFPKISKCLAIGSLNAMGLSLDIKIIFKPYIIFLFLSKLRNFLNKMKKTSTAYL